MTGNKQKVIGCLLKFPLDGMIRVMTVHTGLDN
jgi:hypothetical protein